jgi:hypothetical protein
VLCGVGAYALQSKAGLLAGETLPQGIIVLGVFIILISFLGCLAAFKESRCFLGIVREDDTAQIGERWARCCTELRHRLLTNVFSFSLTFFSQPSPLVSF